MNDRFKFRAWNTKTHELKEVTAVILHRDQHGFSSTVKDKINCNLCYQPHLVLEQCSGLKDKNGRLIYEGDIVKAEVEEPELKVIGIITFGRYVHDLGFYVEWKGVPAESRKYYPGWRQDLFYWLEEASVEVIGNIHENPEFLEAENDRKN